MFNLNKRFMSLGPMQIILILVIVLIIFGVGKLPQVGEALGKGLKSFKKAQEDDLDEDKKEKEKKDSEPKAVAEAAPTAPAAQATSTAPAAEATPVVKTSPANHE